MPRNHGSGFFTEQEARRLRDAVSERHTMQTDTLGMSPETLTFPAEFKNTALPVPTR